LRRHHCTKLYFVLNWVQVRGWASAERVLYWHVHCFVAGRGSKTYLSELHGYSMVVKAFDILDMAPCEVESFLKEAEIFRKVSGEWAQFFKLY
jgi:hypothetical protein